MKILDLVVLQKSLPKHHLKKGDVGTVVHVHRNNGCEVEFVTLDGRTLAVVSLKSSEVRKASKHEIPRNRAVA